MQKWSLENWPFQEVSEETHQKLIEHQYYNVQPLAAYTPNESLIKPPNYQ